MQLVITHSLTIKNKQLQINDKNILHHMKDVMRIKSGEMLSVQNEDTNKTTRYEIEVTSINKENLIGTIVRESTQPNICIKTNKDTRESLQYLGMIIAMANKRDKIELIVQKLSEIGVDEILLRPSERSVIKEANDKKMERLRIISKEAVEQSRGRRLPKIIFVQDIKDIVKDSQIIIFDKSGQDQYGLKTSTALYGVIGPEGGLTPKDYAHFDTTYTIQNLGNTVLRMETACIIGAWILKNKGVHIE